jgi:chromatin structure-remodeling complex subunit RSC9
MATDNALPTGNTEQNRNEFMAKLQAYHEKRGTTLDPAPRVFNQEIDLKTLFDIVVLKGGYDKVSDEKLAWRKIGNDHFHAQRAKDNQAAFAFQLKTVYYKNLAAYEITTIHDKEPPPKEILEETTARGGDLLNRTLENFRPSVRRETNALMDNQSEASGDDGTPARDAGDDTPGSGGRATRGLRQAPPQRVLFQPDTLPARQSRTLQQAQMSSTPSAPHTPRVASSYNTPVNGDLQSQSVANYEPRPQQALSIRPVYTPSNDIVQFKKHQALQNQVLGGAPKVAEKPRIMLPGTGFEGPNIYVRCLLALKSDIAAEQDYALHHLVKISKERGDKYRFESFAGLAEALVEKILEVSSLFYDVNWQVAYPDDGNSRDFNTLDGLDGTPDILQRLEKLQLKEADDNIQPEAFANKLLQVTEAALTLRNMTMLEENAHYICEMRPLRDMLTIVLNLPEYDSVVELKHYALDTIEQLTKYWYFTPESPLYTSLLKQLESSDRGAILTTLRALSRISLNLERQNRLDNIPTSTLDNLLQWMLLDDEELTNACLDFLYQYTAVVPNVNKLIQSTNLPALITQITRLLTWDARPSHFPSADTGGSRPAIRPPTSGESTREVPAVPEDLRAQLAQLAEPERSSKWLRCLFEEDRESYITQIALWQAYQACFTPIISSGGREMLAAADFIKNVSTTFADKAAAQVQSGQVQKFIIKGIRVREVPVEFDGRPYTKCRWVYDRDTPVGAAMRLPCDKFFMGEEGVYTHIMKDHVRVPHTEDGRLRNEKREYQCLWQGCRKYLSPTLLSTRQLGAHVRIHLKTAVESSSFKVEKRTPAPGSLMWMHTAQDERGEAAGVPLTAALVLRNLARNIPKTEAEELVLKEENGAGYVSAYFKPLMSKIWETWAYNRPLVS